MVATKLSEVAGQGWGWLSSGTSSKPDSNEQERYKTGTTLPTTPVASGRRRPTAIDTGDSSSSYWEYAQDTVQNAAEQTYSTVAGYVSSWSPRSNSGGLGGLSDTASDGSPMEAMIMENMPVARRRSTLLSSPTVLNMFQNPYVNIRGGRKPDTHQPRRSIAAVRSLIDIVPTGDFHQQDLFSEGSSTHHNEMSLTEMSNSLVEGYLPQHLAAQSSSSETASHLAEGTLRAFRDIALDEAVELHAALRHWSERWERPLLSWLEAGPSVWFSQEGYRHKDVGQKVSQIQAVLARRCAMIGDLQQHLLRAGWQRGVAQWGVLGRGAQWATVAGGDGGMSETRQDTTPTMKAVPGKSGFDMTRVPSELLDHVPPHSRPELPRKPPNSNVSQLPQSSRHNQLYYTNVFVRNNDGGKIIIDDPALAEWSVDAISLVRRQLRRAANGLVVLPYAENWIEEDDQSRLSYDAAGMMLIENATAATDETIAGGRLPLWASLRMSPVPEEGVSDFPNITEDDDAERANKIQISDMPLFVNEVSALLDVMEPVMIAQRARRLDKLRAPSWLTRNWYIGALAFPPLVYFSIQAAKNGYGWGFLKSTGRQMLSFFHEHVVDPVSAMYEEFTKGTEDISDREARNVAIKNLQKMIRSWLDETYPEMSVKERKRMAKNMDISLIEAEKEESMKTIYNINSVIRMSFIEAQFLKKEMMNALLAMDEMRASTNFNMNMAAVTPFVLLVYTAQRAFKFVFYAMLKVGKSREETYGSFFNTLLEMERLLLMRDNPPAPPSSKNATADAQISGDTVLNADDMGMVMLHIHELRITLWRDRRRFSSTVIKSVAEDLAELSGERGAVSVRQQLQIITRMFRTYPFLKNVTTQMLSYW